MAESSQRGLTSLGPISSEDFEAIRVATTRAEKGTGGEVVVYITARSDPYPESRFMAATLLAILASGVAALIHELGDFWGMGWILWWVVPPVVGAAVGYFLGAWSPIARFLVDDSLADLRTRRRAEVAFLDEEIFNTRDRTGVLLFVSLFERRALVLADSGIHSRVDSSEWTAISEAVADGIHDGRAGEVVIAAVRRCGRLLAERGVERRSDDLNELSDEPRLRNE